MLERHNQRKAAANQTMQTAMLEEPTNTNTNTNTTSTTLTQAPSITKPTALPPMDSPQPSDKLVDVPPSTDVTLNPTHSPFLVDFDYGMGIYSPGLLDIDFTGSGTCGMHDHQNPTFVTSSSSSSPQIASPTSTSSHSNNEQILDALIASMHNNNNNNNNNKNNNNSERTDTVVSNRVGGVVGGAGDHLREDSAKGRLSAPWPGPKDKNVDDDGTWQNSLHIAATKGFDRITRILLQHGDIDCNEKDSDGVTPLILATIGGYDDVVGSLLSHGASLGIVDGEHDRSAIHWAIVHRRDSLLKVLLDQCVAQQTPIDLYDKSGRTPLHMAVHMGYDAGVQLLLSFGANAQQKTKR
jgi:hypothetical protein